MLSLESEISEVKEGGGEHCLQSWEPGRGLQAVQRGAADRPLQPEHQRQAALQPRHGGRQAEEDRRVYRGLRPRPRPRLRLHQGAAPAGQVLHGERAVRGGGQGLREGSQVRQGQHGV